MDKDRSADETTSNRSKLVWGTCDELAAEGTKPTMRLVRARGKMRGSDADIQTDVNVWFSKAFEQLTLNRQVDPIPDALKQAMTILWGVASTEAAAEFDVDREAIQKTLLEEQTAHSETKRALNDALDRIEQANKLLASRQSDIGRLQSQVESDSTEILGLTSQLSSIKVQLNEEKKRHASEHEQTIKTCRARIEEIKTECDRRIDELTTTNQQHITTLKSQLEASESARDEANKHAMREIDIARQSAKVAQSEVASKQETITKMAQRTKEVEEEAANLRIEVATLGSTLNSERELFGIQITHAKEELAVANRKHLEETQSLTTLSSQFEALTAKLNESIIHSGGKGQTKLKT